MYRSADRGETWERVGSVGADVSLIKLVVAPSTRPRIYAAADGALFVSDDSGATWSQVLSHALSTLTVNPIDPRAVVAGRSDLVESVDGGSTWRTIPLDLGQALVLALSFDRSGQTLFIGTSRGIVRATRSSAGWLIQRVLEDIAVGAVESDADSDDTFYGGGSFTGLWKSIDGGRSWNRSNLGLMHGAVSRVIVDPDNGAVVLIAADQGVFRSTDAGANWSALDETLEGASGLAMDPTHRSTLLANNYRRTEKSIDGGLSWIAVNPDLEGNPLNGASAMAISPADPETIYVAMTHGVSQSHDGGTTWTMYSDGLWTGDGDVARELVVNPQMPSMLYVAGYAGLYRSLDGGRTWRQSSDLNDGGYNSVAIDPAHPERIIGGGSGLFETVDGGQHWHSFGLSLPTKTVTAVRFDGLKRGRLYVATADRGVFISSDGGVTWAALKDGLPNIAVDDLAVDANGVFVYAATNLGLFAYEIRPPKRRAVSR